MNLTLTPAASRFINRMVRFGGMGSDAGFRLTVSPGGCSGMSSEFSIESEPKSGDATVEVDGIKLFLPVESRLLLEGITIDFADTPTQTGLTFINPNAAPCSCGSTTGTHTGLPGVVKIGLESLKRH